jgi:hypothetical protein
MAIDRQWIVNLKGKDFPLYAGVLDAATDAGLKSLTTTVLQLPSADNGHYAAVMARAEFADGRVFEDIGDCSPQSTGPHLAAAALRLASTRAKGRCLRDAINCGSTMFEELPDGETGEAAAPTASGHPAKHAQVCEWPAAAGGCKRFLTGDQCANSQAAVKKYLCPAHLGELQAGRAKKAAAAAETAPEEAPA